MEEEVDNSLCICVYGETSANLLLKIPLDTAEETASPAKVIRAVCRYMEKEGILDDPVFAQMELLDCFGRALHPTTEVEAGATLHMQSRKGPLDLVFHDEACIMVLVNDMLPLRVPYALGTGKHKINTYLRRVLAVGEFMVLVKQNPSRCGPHGLYHYTLRCEEEPLSPPLSKERAEPHFLHDERQASVIHVHFVDIDTTVDIPFAMARADYAIKVAQEIGKVEGAYVPQCDPTELLTRGTTLTAQRKE